MQKVPVSHTQTLAKKKPSLRLTRPSTASRPWKRRNRAVFSWDGLENLREQIRHAAQEVKNSHETAIQAAAKHDGFAAGEICVAMKAPADSSCPEVLRAAVAQQRLRDFHSTLVLHHNLDWHFVRQEWACILDPRPEEAQLCQRLVAEGMMDNLLVQ
jgi:hypothetical protein